jgi:hypothetical protein
LNIIKNYLKQLRMNVNQKEDVSPILDEKSNAKRLEGLKIFIWNRELSTYDKRN